VNGPVQAPGRNDAIDFFRGLGLWAIYIDHIAPNVWSNFTLWQLGFSDFAEVFVFLSGYIAAGMYRRALDTGGWPHAFGKMSFRTLRLYSAHIGAMTVVLAILGFCAWRGLRLPEPVLYLWLDHPAEYLLRMLGLAYAPHLLSLLPLYIVVSPLLLLAVEGLRRAPFVTMAVSFTVWAVSFTGVFDLPVMLRQEAWYFRPASWQFLFVIGAACSLNQVKLQKAASARLFTAAAVAIVGASFLVKTGAHFTAVRDAMLHFRVPARLLEINAGKPHLAPFRLVHFLSLLILVVALLAHHRKWLTTGIARIAIACGRRSLVIYCVSLVLATIANLLLVQFQGGPPVQFLYSALGLALLCALAWL
jgi:hypothetical protein